MTVSKSLRMFPHVPLLFLDLLELKSLVHFLELLGVFVIDFLSGLARFVVLVIQNRCHVAICHYFLFEMRVVSNTK